MEQCVKAESMRCSQGPGQTRDGCKPVRNGYPLTEMRSEDWYCNITLLPDGLFIQFLHFFRNNFIYNLIFPIILCCI